MDFKRTDKTSNGHVRPMSAPHPDGQTNRLQQIFNKPSRLPQAHAEQDFHGQTDLDRGIAELLLTTAFAAPEQCPDHVWIKPDRKRSASLQCVIVCRPVRGRVFRRGPNVHTSQLSC